MSKMRIANARDPEQLQRMQDLLARKGCFFCERGSGNKPVLYENRGWYVVKNDFPYKGSVHHYLIVSREHIDRLEDAAPFGIDLFDAISWLQSFTVPEGFSLFVRDGDMKYTGATIDHVHFHFLSGEMEGNGNEKLKVTLGYKKPQ